MILAKRANVRSTDTAHIRTWRSRDLPGAIAEIRSLLGLPRYYLAIRLWPNGNESVVSRHRKRKAAIESLERRLRCHR